MVKGERWEVIGTGSRKGPNVVSVPVSCDTRALS